MRKITAYPRQLESLICLSEVHARMRFSNTVEIVDVKEAARLHREALKALQELLCKKTKTPTVGYDRLFLEFKGKSDIQITREMFEDAI